MIKKVVIIYLVLMFLIWAVYLVDSLFSGSVIGFIVKNVEDNNEDKFVNDEIKTSESVEEDNTKKENGNLITGQVTTVNSLVEKNTAIKEESQKNQLGAIATFNVSVGVVG